MNNNKTATTMIIGAITVVGVLGIVATTLVKKDKIKLSKPKKFGVIKHY